MGWSIWVGGVEAITIVVFRIQLLVYIDRLMVDSIGFRSGDIVLIENMGNRRLGDP